LQGTCNVPAPAPDLAGPDGSGAPRDAAGFYAALRAHVARVLGADGGAERALPLMAWGVRCLNEFMQLNLTGCVFVFVFSRARVRGVGAAHTHKTTRALCTLPQK
jgi:hypothetical protein